MDNNFLSGGIAELQEAKEAVKKTAELQAVYNAASAEAAGKEKDLESQKRYVNDKVNTAIKERRNQLKKTHDEQVDVANKNLKDAERKRRAAKTEAVQARISTETSDLVVINEDLAKSTKQMFRENSIPSFCNTSFYYSMYAPKKPLDFLVLIVTVIITLGVIPNIVCLLMSQSQLIVKILVYLAIVVFFVGLYFLFFAISRRNTNGQVLESARPNREAIKNNKKLIRKRSRTIEKDKDESTYGLEGFDSEIQNFQNILNDTIQKRDDALKAFDEGTALEIRQQIELENQPVIDKMTAELEESKQKLEAAKADATEASDIISKTVELYLGKKNTSVEKIDSLISLLREGKASTIMEALDILNGEIK